MNGATAELCAKISSPPTIKSTMIIGVSHHHLFCQKNWSSSPAIANRLTRFWIRRMPAPRLPSSQGLLHDDIPEDEGVHSAVVERSERLEWCVDDRLAPQVEGRVEHEGYTSGLRERLHQTVVPGIPPLAEDLGWPATA